MNLNKTYENIANFYINRECEINSPNKVIRDLKKIVSPQELIALGFDKDAVFKKPFQIEYWETEEDRNQGFGEIYLDFSNDLKNKSIDEAIAYTRKMYFKTDFRCVELLDANDQVIYHIHSGQKKVIEKDYSKVIMKGGQ